ncbi:MAG: hypothetical protein F4Z15_02040 [Gammaproteobacteria bacterium]|nr:hypothetical protein [Gammaproteobacteria bacterium]MYJ51199.1 hypothetical protein [Gammaproteobacteria bacterium]
MEKDIKIARIHERIRSIPAIFRIIIGLAFLVGGVLGALPILGFWMLPIGLIILSFDFPWANRAYVYLKTRINKFTQTRQARKEDQ